MQIQVRRFLPRCRHDEAVAATHQAQQQRHDPHHPVTEPRQPQRESRAAGKGGDRDALERQKQKQYCAKQRCTEHMIGIRSCSRWREFHDYLWFVQQRLALHAIHDIGGERQQFCAQGRWQKHRLPARHAPVDALVHQDIKRHSDRRYSRVVGQDFVSEGARHLSAALLGQPAAEGLVKVIPDTGSTVVEEVLVGVNDVLFAQIPRQAAVKRGFLGGGEIEVILPDRALLTLITPELPGWW